MKKWSILLGIKEILDNGFTEEVLLLFYSVEVTGRPIHRLQMMIPRSVSGKPGY